MTDSLDPFLSKMLASSSGEAIVEAEDSILEPLLGEIALIKDKNIANFVRAVLLNAGSFWHIPSNHVQTIKNPIDEHAEGGNVLHTQRVVRVAKLLATAYELDEQDWDIVIAAALLHDVTKGTTNGYDSEPMYDVLHPYTVDRFVRVVHRNDQTYAGDHQSSTLFVAEDVVEKILRAIRCHMGIWSPIPETKPVKKREMIVHLANLIAKSLPEIIDGEDIQEWRWAQDLD